MAVRLINGHYYPQVIQLDLSAAVGAVVDVQRLGILRREVLPEGLLDAVKDGIAELIGRIHMELVLLFLRRAGEDGTLRRKGYGHAALAGGHRIVLTQGEIPAGELSHGCDQVFRGHFAGAHKRELLETAVPLRIIGSDIKGGYLGFSHPGALLCLGGRTLLGTLSLRRGTAAQDQAQCQYPRCKQRKPTRLFHQKHLRFLYCIPRI